MAIAMLHRLVFKNYSSVGLRNLDGQTTLPIIQGALKATGTQRPAC